MKYDSWDDFFYFILGASIASGRSFWVGENGGSNKKSTKNSKGIQNIQASISKDGRVVRLRSGEIK